MGNLSVNGRHLAHGTSSFVSQVVRDNCVVIFSKTTCPYCQMAKEVFDEMGVKYQTVELNQRPDGPDVASDLRKFTGINTVPQVFVNGTCIGGGTETKQLYAEGKLAELVKKCTPCSENKSSRL